MDFSTISQSLATTTHTMHILGPDGLPMWAYTDPETQKASVTSDADNLESRGIEYRAAVFKVVGQDSAAYRKRRAELYNLFQKRKRLKFNENEEERLKTVAAAVVGWDGIPWNGEWLEFTDANVLTFMDGYRPAYDQADEEMANRGNFARSA